jgi:Fe-Mn family superoxide dismutase
MKLTRKEFAFNTVAAAAVDSVSPAIGKGKTMKEIILEKLPYAEDALAPIISANTVSFHYGKHHAGYVKTLNGLIIGTKYEGMTLEEIVKASAADANAPVFNNAAQSWNHAFYWNTLSPDGKNTVPSHKLLAAMNAAFGSFGACKDALADAAAKRFGSGWAWLVSKDGKLSVVSTPNAETPVTDPDIIPLAVVDVWEHAYYLDWQNRRPDHVKEVIGSLFDWHRISGRFEKG